MEFSTKVGPHTPENEGGGIVVREVHTLFNKFSQNDIILLKKLGFEIIDENTVRIIKDIN